MALTLTRELGAIPLPVQTNTQCNGNALYLEVVLNGETVQGLTKFSCHDGLLGARYADLRKIGLHIPGIALNDIVIVAKLAGVTHRYDMPSQTLILSVPASMLGRTATMLNTKAESAAPLANVLSGLMLSYDLSGMRNSDGSQVASAYTELRGFKDGVVYSTTSLGRIILPAQGTTQRDMVRLDSNIDIPISSGMQLLRLGDTVTGALPWTRGVRIGGVQFRRDFAQRPEEVNFPIPAFFGEAAVPSTVELFVDGIRRYVGDVPSGRFQLYTNPSTNGLESAQVVMTDSLGHRSVLDFSYYQSAQLLRPGLSDYSVEFGSVRKDYGLTSFAYSDKPMASGMLRRGLTDQLTVEAHTEVASSTAVSGVGAVAQLGFAGNLSGAYIHSNSAEGNGSQISTGYSWRNRHVSLSLDHMSSKGMYRDVASLYSRPPLNAYTRASVTWDSAWLGTLGLSYMSLDSTPDDRSRFANIFFSRRIGRDMLANLMLNQDLDHPNERRYFVGVLIPLGSRNLASASCQSSARGCTGAVEQRSEHSGAERGVYWRAREEAGSQSTLDGELGYRGDHAEFDVRGERTRDRSWIAGEMQGSLVMTTGQLFTSRRIDDAFAVVSTGGMPGVPVMLQNRLVGVTDENGLLLVPSLLAYQRNLLTINTLNLPADIHIDRVDTLAVPPARGGAFVDFKLSRTSAAVLKLQDEHGNPLPAGATGILANSANTPFVVGFDGTVYLEGVASDNLLRVRSSEGECEVRFKYQQVPGVIPTLGPYICHTLAK